MLVTIDKVVYPGMSLASVQGKVWMTDDGLPGEVVDVRPVKEKRNYIEARTVDIVRPSAERIAPRCSHYKVCGPYQIMSYPFQLKTKQAQVSEILSRWTDLAGPSLEPVPSPKDWHYRNKTRLHILRDRGNIRLAYNIPGSRDEFAPIQECFLLSEPINRLLADLTKVLSEQDLPPLEEVEVRESRAGGELLLTVFSHTRHGQDGIDSLITGLASRHPLAGIVCLGRTKSGFEERTSWGKNYIEEMIGTTRFEIGSQSFFQVNIDLLPRVIQDIEQMAELQASQQVADFYCGLGTFGIALAPKVRNVFGIESSPDNIKFLKKNLAANRAQNFTICEGPSEEWVSWILERAVDAVLFDPPRRGLGAEVIRGLVQNPAARLIYLSCNPATLARDLRELAGVYKIRGLRVYDFFPQTPHIETLAVLGRN